MTAKTVHIINKGSAEINYHVTKEKGERKKESL
jgi:hypothetical protein